MQDAIAALCRSLAGGLAGAREISPEIEPYVSHMRASTAGAVHRSCEFAAPQHDPRGILAAAVGGLAGDGVAIARAIEALPGPLPWTYGYEVRAGEEDLPQRIAFAELIGPLAPLTAPDCRVGFTLMAADTEYPLHAHPAVELYWVLSGHAGWRTTGGERIVAPGHFVLHRSSEPHAMRTRGEPLLALWSWSGDLDSPAYYLPA